MNQPESLLQRIKTKLGLGSKETETPNLEAYKEPGEVVFFPSGTEQDYEDWEEEQQGWPEWLKKQVRRWD